MDCTVLACLAIIWNPFSEFMDRFLKAIEDNVFGGVTSMVQLASRAEDLERGTTHLRGAQQDLLHQIDLGRLEDKKPTQQTDIWLQEVSKVVLEGEKFMESYRQKDGLYLQYYQLGCQADKVLKNIRRLESERTNLTVLEQALPNPVVPWQDSSSTLVGAEEIFSKILGLVQDGTSEKIGIYGMGGVGKTALMQEINNHFLKSSSKHFDVVIFVTVSSDVSIYQIQRDIGQRLGYSSPNNPLPEDIDNRKTKLLTELHQKKFLLLLDDLWDKLELHKVGIPVSPLSKIGSKIVFSTRSSKVCKLMEAAEVQVPYLNEAKSWELFCRCLGNTMDDLTASAESLAERVAKKCGGLPLALTALGHAMTGASTDREWEDALDMLQGLVAEADGIQDDIIEVRSILKFSFDRLKDDRHKKCLLYCAFFPEDFEITESQLIEYWAGEGFLETTNCSLERARNAGQIVVNTLKAACLLEVGRTKYEGEDTVKLHDMVRDMALWISNGDAEEEEKKIRVVNRRDIPDHATMSKSWSNATRISIMYNEISELPLEPCWQNLQTLQLRFNRNLQRIERRFFASTPCLVVLDLSGTGIKRLPPEISLLVKLRYLNLEYTYLKTLPEELGRLMDLRILNLGNCRKLKRIPKEAISPLSWLQSLSCSYQEYNEESVYQWRGGWKDGDGDYEGRDICVKDLEGLERLEELNIKIRVTSQEDLRGLSDCRKLYSAIKDLSLESLESVSSSDFFDIFRLAKGLRKLCIKNCSDLNSLILPADGLAKLEELSLHGLPLDKISFNDDRERELPFPKLRRISLENMQNMESISSRSWVFPCLKEVKLVNCPKLTKLPFGSKSSKYLWKLNISQCDALEEISQIRGLPSLQDLTLSKCAKMMEIITFKELEMNNTDEENVSLFPELRGLDLDTIHGSKSINDRTLLFPLLMIFKMRNCPELTKLPIGLDNAKNLRYLYISNCEALQDITCIKDLPHLEYLWLHTCTKMMEIIILEESETMNKDKNKDSLFPSLTSIQLYDMDNLKCISRQPILFPRLEDVFVINCPKLTELTFGLNSVENLRKLNISSRKAVQEMEWNVNLPCLKSLSLRDCPKMTEIIAIEESDMSRMDNDNDSFLDNKQNLKRISRKPLLLPSLEKIFIGNCSELTIQPFALYSTKNIKDLTIVESEALKDITWIRELQFLDVLHLGRCPNMFEMIILEESEGIRMERERDLFFPRLRKMTMVGMKNLRNICNQHLPLPRLQEVRIRGCPELKKLPFGPNSAKNLQKVKICECESLEGIEWIKELPCLETLCLSKCSKIKEIVVVEESHMIGIDRKMESHFPRLRKIALSKMQQLKSICNLPLMFPALEKVHILDCPDLKKLPFGEHNSAENIMEILGEPEWWDALEWGDDDHRSKFAPYFKRWKLSLGYWGNILF